MKVFDWLLSQSYLNYLFNVYEGELYVRQSSLSSPSPAWPQYGTSTHPPEVLCRNFNHQHQHPRHPPPVPQLHHHDEAPGKYSCNKISNFPSAGLVRHYHQVKMPA